MNIVLLVAKVDVCLMVPTSYVLMELKTIIYEFDVSVKSVFSNA